MGNKKMTPAEIEATRERLRNFAKNGFDSPNEDGEQEKQETPDLEAYKPEIIKKLKEYIEKEIPEKKKKKHAKFLNDILSASSDKISFGISPTYEMGYVYGNVSAKGKDYLDGVTYYKTFETDLQSPEKPFFKDGDKETCFKACAHFNKLRKASNTLVNGKYTWKVYFCDEEEEALNDYAAEVCGEKFRRIDYELTDTRVNDYEYVRTEPIKDCLFYPVYVTAKNDKGKEDKILIGYYDANINSMDCDIDFKNPDKLEVILRIGFCLCFAIPIIVFIIMCIVDQSFLSYYFS